jgi:hypothetical protein
VLGYEYYGSPNYSLPINTAIPFSLTPGYLSTNQVETWSVWVDLNRDNDFSDPGELVWSLGNGAIGAQTGTFTLPAGTSTGYTRMRIRMNRNSPWPACGTGGLPGDIKDFNVYLDDHCTSFANSTGNAYIDGLSFASGFTSPGGFSAGYSNFIGQGPNMNIATANAFTLTPGYNPFFGPVPANAAIYMDYNRDGDFSDNGELVYSNNGFSGVINGVINPPVNVTAGPVRMRVIMTPNAINSPCSTTYTSGEVEDYTAALLTDCNTPTQLWSSAFSATSAYIGCAQKAGVSKYYFQYRLQGATAWINVNSATPAILLNSLTENVNYQFHVRVRCLPANNYSAYSAIVTFKIPASSTPCGASANKGARPAATTATLYYAYAPGNAGYRVQYRPVGSPTWIMKTSTTAIKAITLLTPMTTYEWQVAVKCGATYGAYSAATQFVTLPSLSLGNVNADDREEEEVDSNPTQGDFTLGFDNAFEEKTATLVVYNLSGKMVLQQRIELTDGDNQIAVRNSDWNTGVYMVALKTAQTVVTGKVVVQK